MTSKTRFCLDFSGQDAFKRARRVTESLTHVDSSEHGVRTRLLAILAAAQVFFDPPAAMGAAQEARREAELAGDDISRAWMLMATSIADVSPNGVRQRLAATQEVLGLAEKTGESEFAQTAYFLNLSALAELGMIPEIDRALSPNGPLLAAFPWLEDGRHVAWFRCLRATIDGQADRAEEIASQALQIALEHGDPDAQSVWVGQLAIIRWMQGRVVELEPAFLHARQLSPHEPIWAVSLAWMWLRQGRRSAARSLIASLPPFAELPFDRNWLSTACILADVAAELDEKEIAAVVGEALKPFENRLVTIGLGVTCWGTVSRALALVAKSLGDTDSAVEHYRKAIDLAGRIGAHPWLAEAQLELATLLAENDEEHQHEAFSLATEAAVTSRTLNLHSIERAATVLVNSLQAPDESYRRSRTAEDANSAPKINILGAFEVISADGTFAQWQSRKARQLLKILVSRRGIPIRRDMLVHLLWPDETPQKVSNRLSVAVSTVRRALDPHRALPSDTYLHTHGKVLRLCTERLDIDLERFLAETSSALGSAPLTATDADGLRDTLELFRGAVFTDEAEDFWVEELRTEVHEAFFAAAHLLAESSHSMGDELTRLECYRRILEIDGYDQRAHEGFIDTLSAMGAHGRASMARQSYQQRMDELNVAIDAPRISNVNE